MQALRRQIARRPHLKAALLPLVRLLFRLRHRAFLALRALGLPVPRFLGGDWMAYSAWVRRHGALSPSDRAIITGRIEAWADRPLLSVVMPVYNPRPEHLEAAIASVRAQLWPDWELCIADDASTDARIPALLERLAGEEPRLRWVRRAANGHICAASNTALGLARGEWVVLMDHDDLLPPEALYEVAAAARRHPEAQVIFSDEDKIDERGQRHDPHFKPGFDPELLLAQNLVSHLGAYRRALLERLGGFREGFEGSQDHDLALRCLAAVGPGGFVHIPAILYHWRQENRRGSFSQAALDRCVAASRRAVEDHLAGIGLAARVLPSPNAPVYNWVIPALPDPAPLVSVIIPTRDRAELLEVALDGLLNGTDYPRLEVLVVDNDSREEATRALFARLAADPRVRILPAPGPFNYAALNNAAARAAQGEILLLLNNDTKVIAPGWLTPLVAQAARPEIGAVGARLLYEDETIQHAGVVLGAGAPEDAVAGHFGHGRPRAAPGPFGWLAVTRSVSAVTAACLAVKRADYLMVGGMDETALRVAFNDIDFCLRLQAAGRRNLHVGEVEMFHLESKSRGYEDTPEKLARFHGEVATMRARWGAVLDDDPHWSPNLSLIALDGGPAETPRRPRSWRDQPGG